MHVKTVRLYASIRYWQNTSYTFIRASKCNPTMKIVLPAARRQVPQTYFCRHHEIQELNTVPKHTAHSRHIFAYECQVSSYLYQVSSKAAIYHNSKSTPSHSQHLQTGLIGRAGPAKVEAFRDIPMCTAQHCPPPLLEPYGMARNKLYSTSQHMNRFCMPSAMPAIASPQCALQLFLLYKQKALVPPLDLVMRVALLLLPVPWPCKIRPHGRADGSPLPNPDHALNVRTLPSDINTTTERQSLSPPSRTSNDYHARLLPPVS